ncbi:MAG: hypothetical protein N2109_08965 [Fimbriimonadales bacterium]|nr:hypothetical protein [Fimbriimonadales bacterium]
MRWDEWWLELERGFALSPSSCHGPDHWRAVERNGLWIARNTAGVDAEVVRAFALFHDSQREDDGYDLEHGPRAAAYVRLHRARIPLQSRQIELLIEACEGHTRGGMHPDPTVAACWDADRLDLGRIGIRPDPRRLGTECARKLARSGGDIRRTVLRLLREDRLAADAGDGR